VIKKFAYIRPSPHPINDSIIQTLSENFPNLEVDVINIRELLKKRKTLILANMFFVFIEYGREILLSKKQIRECFWRTPFIFRTIKGLVSSILSRERYEFSIQNQSLFDGSREGLPHYVYTDHTHLANLHYPGFERKNLYSQKWIEMERSIYHNAVINFTRSNYAADSIVQDYGCPPEKVICVYAGSNVGTDFTVNREKYKNKNILFVGVDWKRKGGPDLVEAFKLVLKVYPDARLTIVGSSPKLDIPNCDVVGQVPLQNVNYYYENASVFCLPSRLEPAALVFLEASAHELPVVTTKVGGSADRVIDGETGYLVEPGNVEQLSKMLIELIGNPEKCQTFGENGRRLVLERYTWQKVGNEIAKNIMATINLQSFV
jgi:glycosyltransferase involved in cell wall biosynthesis